MAKQPKILIVEDDHFYYDNLREFLEESGYEVAPFTNCYEDGLQYFKEFRPDVILMDINLKGQLNGINLAQKIRETSNLPIIFSSEHQDISTIKLAGGTRPRDYILKGSAGNMQQLLTTLTLALDESNTSVKPRVGILVQKTYKIYNASYGETEAFIIPFEEITYIEVLHLTEAEKKETGATGSGYLKIHTEKGNSYYKRESLGDLYLALPDYFQMIHRSTIVNILKLNAPLNGRTIQVGKRVFRVSLVHKIALMKKIEKYFH